MKMIKLVIPDDTLVKQAVAKWLISSRPLISSGGSASIIAKTTDKRFVDESDCMGVPAPPTTQAVATENLISIKSDYGTVDVSRVAGPGKPPEAFICDETSNPPPIPTDVIPAPPTTQVIPPPPLAKPLGSAADASAIVHGPGMVNKIVEEIDSAGMPWDARIHASTKTKVNAGTWKYRQKVDKALVAQVEAEHKSSGTTGIDLTLAAAVSPIEGAVATVTAQPAPATFAELIPVIVENKIDAAVVQTAVTTLGYENLMVIGGLTPEEQAIAIPQILALLGQ